MKTFCVYMITSGNGLSYIGIASNLERRLKEHANRTESYVSRAVRKHGIKSVLILHEGLSFEDAAQLEIKEIKERKTQNPFGLNIARGGQGCCGFPTSLTVIEQRRQRMIKYNKSLTPEERSSRAKASAKPWSAERKQRHAEQMRKRHADRKDQGLPSAITNAIKVASQPWSEERRNSHKAAMQKALSGKMWSEERKAKHGENIKAGLARSSMRLRPSE